MTPFQRNILLIVAGVALGVNLLAVSVAVWCDHDLSQRGISIAQMLER